jgi:hypothetical protein
MSVMSIIVWTCDICGVVESIAERTSPWSDADVGPPAQWEGNALIPEKYRSHPLNDAAVLCPACAVRPNWDLFKRGGRP